MNRLQAFRSLLLREWMQHRTGWLVLMLLPSLLMAVLGLFDGVGLDVRVGDRGAQLGRLSALPVLWQTLGWTVSTTGLALLLVALSVLFQLPGLARRDQQDRSIAFWRALPVSDVQAAGATVLMHLLLLPAAVLAAALLGAQLVAMLAIVLHQGPLAWLQQPWPLLLASLLLALGRVWLGLLLAVLWLSPVLLLTMAAAAWLRRWAMPVLTAASLLGVYWLDGRLPQPLVGPAFQRIGTEALYALLAPDLFDGPQRLGLGEPAALVAALPAALLQDAGRVLASAASLPFVGAVAVGALGLVLLVRARARER
jgi:hypothetical protein